MPSVEDVRAQQMLLATHRATLSIRLKQLAAHGDSDAPPVIFHDINLARAEIQHIKSTLAKWGVPAEDFPSDNETPQEMMASASIEVNSSTPPSTPPITAPSKDIAQVDVLLVTVTAIETRAVLEVWGGPSHREPSKRFIGPNTYYNLGTISGTRTSLVRVTTMGAIGRGGALQTIEQGIRALHPTYVVMVGIAFGTDKAKQQIGDILVGQQIHFYEAQKVKNRSQIIERGNTVPPSTSLLDRFQDSALFWNIAKVHFGLILSGEKLIDSQSFINRLLKRKPEAIGGEMEGAGLYAAAEEAKTDWILVKAICDWADGTKDQNKAESQQMAAFNAARFVLYMLEQGALTPS